jgi:hypothetical protein
LSAVGFFKSVRKRVAATAFFLHASMYRSKQRERHVYTYSVDRRWEAQKCAHAGEAKTKKKLMELV